MNKSTHIFTDKNGNKVSEKIEILSEKEGIMLVKSSTSNTPFYVLSSNVVKEK